MIVGMIIFTYLFISQSLLSFLYCWKVKGLKKQFEEERQTQEGGTVVENEVALQQM